MSNQSAVPSINSLEHASKKSSKKQKVNKILKKNIEEFEYFGGSDVVNKLDMTKKILVSKKRICLSLGLT